MAFAARTFVSLRERDFRYLTLGSVGLGLGQWFQQIGLGWLVLQITGSAVQLGLLATVRGMTVLIASPVGGVLADRMSRRLLLILSTTISAAQATAVALLVLTGRIEIWHLYLFTLLEATANGINMPARQVFVYDVSTRETITNAIALNSIVQNVTRILGPNLAGVLIGFLEAVQKGAGISSCFFALSALKLSSVFFTFLISPTAGQRRSVQRESPITSLVDGLRYAVKDQAILALIVITAIPSVVMYPYVQFLPVFADRVFHAGAQGYGLLASALGVGSIPGGLLIAFLGDVRRKGFIMVATFLVYVALVLLFSRSPTLWLALGFLVIAGVFHSISMTLSNTLFQLWSRDDMRGRVMALHSMTGGLQPLGALPMGFAMELIGAPNTVTIYAALTLLSTIVVFLAAPALRKDPESAVPAAQALPQAGG